MRKTTTVKIDEQLKLESWYHLKSEGISLSDLFNKCLEGFVRRKQFEEEQKNKLYTQG
jgi:antitoxin component of RelBE/YafQ-DinJ toxin-antitoxin module